MDKQKVVAEGLPAEPGQFGIFFGSGWVGLG